MGSGVGLDKGGEDLGVFPEVAQESVTAPMAHDLHCLYWHAMQSVEKGGADTHPMTLEGFLAHLLGGRS